MPNKVGNTSFDGYARFAREGLDLELSFDTLELVLQFSSSPALDSAMFGPYWHIPFFGTTVFKSNSMELDWISTNGVRYFFTKSQTYRENYGKDISNRIDDKNAEVYFDSTGSWIAVETPKSGLRIERINQPDHYFEYKKGRLEKIGIGKEFLTVDYVGSGRVSALRSNLKRVPLLEIGYSPEGLASSMRLGDKIYFFEYHDVEDVDFLHGLSLKGGCSKLLGKIVYPDGGSDMFEYESRPAGSREILSKDFSAKTVPVERVNRMTYVTSNDSRSWLEWCAETGILIADNGGKYSIGNDLSDKGHPGYSSSRKTPSFIFLKYVGTAMKHPEIYYFDMTNMVEIFQKPTSGEIFRHSKVGRLGRIFREDRKVEKLAPGSALGEEAQWDMLSMFIYDDKGRVVRRIQANKSETNYSYDKDGVLRSVIKDGSPIYLLAEPGSKDSLKLFSSNEKGGCIEVRSLPGKSDYEMSIVRPGETGKILKVNTKNGIINFSGIDLKVSN